MHAFARKLLLLSIPALLSGCKAALMNPMGQVAEAEKGLILTSFYLMLLVVVPVILLACIFAIKYRASNKNADYQPGWAYSIKIEMIVWGIPILIIVLLSYICFESTHALDPARPLKEGTKPLEVDVVSLDWKWLFIYPEQNMASVNELAIPAGVPVKFVITSDSVMNVFFVPQLGTQIYAMTGMEARLNLIADKPGTYYGMSANFSGPGFSYMHFDTLALPQSGFDQWVAKAKASAKRLDSGSYAELAKPSENDPVTYYGTVDPKLFHSVAAKYMSVPTPSIERTTPETSHAAMDMPMHKGAK